MKESKKMVFAAFFVALAFVFSLFTITIGQGMQIGITEFPIMVSGFVLGPLYGSLVGLVKDVITMMRMGYPVSIFTLSPILLGLIPGLFLKVFGKEKLYKNVGLLILAVYITTLARTLNNSVALHYVYGMEWKAVIALLPPKLLILAMEGILYVIIFRTLLPIIDKNFMNNDKLDH